MLKTHVHVHPGLIWLRPHTPVVDVSNPFGRPATSSWVDHIIHMEPTEMLEIAAKYYNGLLEADFIDTVCTAVSSSAFHLILFPRSKYEAPYFPIVPQAIKVHTSF